MKKIKKIIEKENNNNIQERDKVRLFDISEVSNINFLDPDSF